MSWFKETMTSSLGKKYIMGLSGLFLVGFLVIHLLGNFTLLSADGTAFNEYAHFMKHNPLIKIGEVVLFLGFIVHAVQGISLVMANKAARPDGYVVAHKNSKVNPISKMMGPLGVILLVFLVWHLYEFFRFKYFGSLDTLNGLPNLHGLVRKEFSGTEGLIHVLAYGLSMVVVALHLNHGFQSAFQSLGVRHDKYTPLIKTVGTLYSIVIPALFAAIPLLIYIQSVK